MIIQKSKAKGQNYSNTRGYKFKIMNLKIEKYYWRKGYKIIIGMDEAGRGPLAGPVTAAAVIVNSKIINPVCAKASAGRQKSKFQVKNQNFREILRNTKDSKKLSEKQREKIFNLAIKSTSIKFAYSSVGPKTIDKINIEKASKKAMKNCLNRIIPKHNLDKILILIDGNSILPYFRQRGEQGDKNLNVCSEQNQRIMQKAIIKGDNKIFSIALASIIAKVIRDRKMKKLSLQYPQYRFHLHKGYGTKLHRDLLKKYGPCKIHRRTYKPMSKS